MATANADEIQEVKEASIASDDDSSNEDGGDEPKLNGEMSSSSDEEAGDGASATRKRSLGSEDGSDNSDEDDVETKESKRARLGSPLTKSDNSDCELDSSPVAEVAGNCVSGEADQATSKDGDSDGKYNHDDDDENLTVSSGDDGQDDSGDVEEVKSKDGDNGVKKDEEGQDHVEDVEDTEDAEVISTDSGEEKEDVKDNGDTPSGKESTPSSVTRLTGESINDSGVVADAGSGSGDNGDEPEPIQVDSDKDGSGADENKSPRRKRRTRTRQRGSSSVLPTTRKTRSEKLNGEPPKADSDDDIIEEKRVEKSEPMKRRSMTRKQDDDPDVQAVDPLDPLADDPLEGDPLDASEKASKKNTIIVNDTKTLVELAAGNKEGSKEPTLVIIDTNSILSGKGPVVVGSSSTATTTSTSSTMGSPSVFSIPNIPIHTGSGLTVMAVPSGAGSQRQSASSSSMSVTVSQPGMECPGLSDDMFVVEAPSFIVPYVYEKPPKESVKEFCSKLEMSGKADEKEKGDSSKTDEEKAKEDKSVEKEEDKNKLLYPRDNFFDSSLGKFFMQIGMNLVQEYVQTDLLRAQKRKAERESGKTSAATQHAISSLLRNLEDSKENNEPFHFETRKCEFCNFKTESALVMAQHLETPHMRHYTYRCNFCPFETRVPHDILFHMEAEHNVRGHLERAPAFHQCANCSFEDNSKGKLSRHILSCMKKFRHDRNQEPPTDWELPAKIYRVSRGRPSTLGPGFQPMKCPPGTLSHPLMPKLAPAPGGLPMAPPLIPNSLHRPRGRPPGPATLASKLGVDARGMANRSLASASHLRPGMIYRPSGSQVYVPSSFSFANNPIYQVVNSQGHMVPVMTGGLSNVPRLTLIPSGGSGSGGGGPSPVALIPNLSSGASSITIQKTKPLAFQSASSRTASPKAPQQPSISITPLPRQTASTPTSLGSIGQGTSPKAATTSSSPAGPKTTFVICEICDGYIKDLEQLRNHMQWIHKVKIHPKMIYNRPPLNCQKCQFRFFTDQGLERHLLGSHGLVTSSMQEAANKGQDGGRCPVCGKVYQWKLLNHVAKDHNLTLKPAHLSYKCTVCTATFGMYKQFENHVYSAHSVVAKRTDKKSSETKSATASAAPATQHLLSQSQSLLKPLKINDEITIIPQPVKSSSAAPAATSSATSGQSSRSASLVQHRMNKKFMCQMKDKEVKCQKMKPGKVKV